MAPDRPWWNHPRRQESKQTTNESKKPMKIHSIHSITLMAATAALLGAASSAHAGEADDAIVASATSTHVFKTILKDDAVKAESRDGVVTLTGTVVEKSHKALAEGTVEGLSGVKSVDNQIKVTGESPPENSDGWLALKVKGALLFHTEVNAFKTEIDAKDGAVVLRGEASSMAQKQLTGEYAADVDGVKSVQNEMTISSDPAAGARTLGEKIDDASITAQVKWSLLAHRSTSALATKVQTRDGVVTVSGVAKSAREKDLVTKLVNGIHGVGSVVNNMSIELAAVSNY